MFWRYCQLINIERYPPSHKGGSEPKSKKYEAVKQPHIFVIRASLPLLVPKAGLEPARCRHHRILSPARLPIPPLRRDLLYYISTKERLWQ